jgi:uncharacterized protein (TIGR03089 family)
MDDVPAVLRRLLTDPGRPRVTWYGPADERVELSGKVLDNWVAKTANLLVDALDVGPGSRVVVDLPPHWRTVVWWLASWSAGACVLVADGESRDQDERIDVLVTDRPDGRTARDWSDRADHVVAVALPALATSFGADLPPDAVDAAVETRSFGDVFVPFVRPTPSDLAYLSAGDGPAPSLLQVPYGELLRFVRAEAAVPDGGRLLTGGPRTDPLLDLFGPLAAQGSVVLHHDPGSLDPAALDLLASQEAVTLRRLR